MGRYFGTNGIRGVLGRGFFTLDFVFSMSAAIGTHMIQKEESDSDILVGYDGRATGPLLCNAISSALAYAGVDCAIAGMTSTPCLEYEVKKHHAGGIMITASHNPPEYNGIKAVASDGIEISRADEKEIEERYEKKQFISKTKRWGSITCKDNFQYIPGIISCVDVDVIRASRLNVIIDSGNGVQGAYAEQLCKSLGCQYTIINEKVDGGFPGRGPEPTPENLSQLSRTVTESGADFGIAFDGDGDRSMFCDDKGTIITGDRSALILAKHILGKKEGGANTGAIMATCLNSSSSAETVAAQFGADVIRTKVGSVEVSQCMRDTDALLGYEENGGFMYKRHNAVRDGCMTLALMLEALAHTGSSTKLSQHAESLPHTYTAKTKVRCNAASDVLKHIKDTLDVSDDRDGLKIVIQDAESTCKSADQASPRWVLIRPSGTEPALRVYAEAPTQQEADKITRQYAEMLLERKGVSTY